VVVAPTSLNRAWDRRLRVYPRFLLAALAAAFVIVIATGNGSTAMSGRLGGDFPAFFGAGSIVMAGQTDDLYEPAAQAAAQIGLLGSEGGFIMYPYPPHVAAIYAPLSELPYRVAYALHTAAMVGAFIGALALIRPMVPFVARWFSATIVVSATAYPVFVGLAGGQNTALSLLLVAAAWRAWHHDRDALAGLALALLLFRPQYAIPLLGLAFLDRRWRTVGSAAIGAAGVWLANAATAGAGWIGFWYDGVRPLLEADAEINAVNEIAPTGVLVAVLGESTAAVAVGGAISAGIIGGLMWAWWSRRLDLGGRMALTAAALPLLGPHAIYYDTSFLLFTVTVLTDRRLLSPGSVGLVWLATWIHLARYPIGANPLVVVIAVVLVIAATRLLRAQPADVPDRVLPTHDSYSVR